MKNTRLLISVIIVLTLGVNGYCDVFTIDCTKGDLLKGLASKPSSERINKSFISDISDVDIQEDIGVLHKKGDIFVGCLGTTHPVRGMWEYA